MSIMDILRKYKLSFDESVFVPGKGPHSTPNPKHNDDFLLSNSMKLNIKSHQFEERKWKLEAKIK